MTAERRGDLGDPPEGAPATAGPDVSLSSIGVELTVSEQRVAHLAARGLTNRQIAEQLLLSEKTVQRHLSSVYKKLRIPGRGWLISAAAGQPREETD